MTPDWATALLGDNPAREVFDAAEFAVATSVAQKWALLHTTIAPAHNLNPLDLQRRACDAYTAISRALQHIAPVCQPVRFWNFIPGIGLSMGDGLDRYMVFNAGRFAAFHGWPKDRAGSPWNATASAVGHSGHDLVIWCLASCHHGEPLENPRQTPVRQYSRRYGPMPPSFARATLVVPKAQATDQSRITARRHAGEPLLLIGGTASIKGERSLHQDNLDAQVEETLANLDALVRFATIRLDAFGMKFALPSDSLSLLQHLRVYFVQPNDQHRIDQQITARFGQSCVIEWIHADLCRPELLVEIEGMAALSVEAPKRRPHLTLHHA